MIQIVRIAPTTCDCGRNAAPSPFCFTRASVTKSSSLRVGCFQLAFFRLTRPFPRRFCRVRRNDDEIRLPTNGTINAVEYVTGTDDSAPCFRFCLSRHRLMPVPYVLASFVKAPRQTSHPRPPRGNFVNRANK